MFPSVLRLVVALRLVGIIGAAPSGVHDYYDVGANTDFELLGDGYCHSPSGTLVAGIPWVLFSGGWKPHVSVEACQAQCAKDKSCAGFEFEVDAKGCRLLKGSVAKASGDHGPFREINCYVNSRRANWAKSKAEAAKKQAEAAKKRDGEETVAPTCNMFLCPPGQKRAPKRAATPWSYGCENGPNEATRDCCISRDICLRTCGMSSVYCYSNFLQCLYKGCVGNEQCIQRSAVVVHEFGSTKEDRCAHYEDAQIEACECVAEAEFRTNFEQWLEGFYAKHQPDKLDDSKKLQHRDQIWKKWANKEPELLHALAKKYKGAVEQRSADEAEMHYLGAWRTNLIAEEDYMTAKRIKRREAFVTRKMEARRKAAGTADGNSTKWHRDL